MDARRVKPEKGNKFFNLGVWLKVYKIKIHEYTSTALRNTDNNEHF